MRRLKIAAIACALGVTVLVGCGDDGAGQNDGGTSGSQSDANEGASADEEQAAPSNDTDTDGAGQDGAGQDGAGSGSAEYCQAAEEMGELAMSDLSAPDASGAGADLAVKIRQIADAAPDDIKADWTTFADAYEQFVNASEDLRSGDPSKLEDVSQQMETAGQLMGDAMESVTSHLQAACS